MSTPFQGETMVCIMSGAIKRSLPNVESGWDCIVIGDKRYYVSKKWREKSYKKRGEESTWNMVFTKINQLQSGGE